MDRASRTIAFCVGVLAIGLIAKADPTYDSWAKTKVGTVVKYSQQTEAMGTKTSGDVTDTLKEVTPEAVTVEMKMTVSVAGQTMNVPPRTLTFKSGGPKSPTTAPAGSTPVAGVTKEDVVVDGKIYSCKVITGSADASGMKTVFKSWTCDDVPGELVKSETSSTGTMTSKTTMTLTSVDAK